MSLLVEMKRSWCAVSGLDIIYTADELIVLYLFMLISRPLHDLKFSMSIFRIATNFIIFFQDFSSHR